MKLHVQLELRQRSMEERWRALQQDLPARRQRRADERVQPVLPRQAWPGRGATDCAPRSSGHAWVPARGLRHGDRHDPRGEVRALRRRHTARVRDELRRPVGRLHGGLLHVRADARAVRRDLPACGGLRRPSGPAGREGVHPRRAADGGRLRAELSRHGQGDPESRACQQRPSSRCSTTRRPRRPCSTRRSRRC